MKAASFAVDYGVPYDPETMAEFKEHFWRHRQQAVAGLIQHAAEKARSVPTSRLTPSPNPYMLRSTSAFCFTPAHWTAM